MGELEAGSDDGEGFLTQKIHGSNEINEENWNIMGNYRNGKTNGFSSLCIPRPSRPFIHV